MISSSSAPSRCSAQAAKRSWSSARRRFGIESYAASRIRMCPKRNPSSPANVRASGLIRPLRTSACRRPATSPTCSGGERSATAPHQKTCPITAARCSTASSSSPSRSRRAASTACTVPGPAARRRPQRLEPALPLDEDAVLDQHPQHLLEEERVASRRTADRVGRIRIERTGQVLEQCAHVLPRQRRERDRRPCPGRPQLREIRARHAADENRRVAAPAGQVLDEVEEGRLGPLDVVEHEHDRPLARERLEQAADRPVELVAPRARLRAPDRLQDPLVHDRPSGTPPRTASRSRSRTTSTSGQ